jgi:flavin reductase (DIM6/NTAB) family NADH-FMN oxidoreductase RutF
LFRQRIPAVLTLVTRLPTIEALSSSTSSPARRAQGFTERQFRDAMAQLATGVTVICTRTPDGRFVGFTANSFNSVSLDPPLVVWTLATRASNLSVFESAERYVVNVLAHDQVELARRFSRPHADRFSGVPYRLGSSGAPLIEGCIAWFECRQHTQLRAGDHILFIGEVEHCERRNGSGLLFHHSRFATMQPLGDGTPT